MREEEKIMAGLLFNPGDPELRRIKLRTHQLNLDYNQTCEQEAQKREKLLGDIVGGLGEGCFIQGPLFFHYGVHTTLGDHFFANFNLTVQDDAPVTIGADCNFGPNVTIVTPVHPMLPDERNAMLDGDGNRAQLCCAKPVRIGDRCWFGANVVVCPGVTIGDGCVIGAGSVVVRDVPPNCFAAGNPCRVIRELSEKDSMRHRPEVLGSARVIE